MTDFSREGGDPPNNSIQSRVKRRPFNARACLEDLFTVLIVAGREQPENRWPTLELGLKTLALNYNFFNWKAKVTPHGK